MSHEGVLMPGGPGTSSARRRRCGRCRVRRRRRVGQADLPLPGRGRTRARWAALADLAEEDLSLARLAEGHADALAILAELGQAPPPAGSRWGVWAAQPPVLG